MSNTINLRLKQKECEKLFFAGQRDAKELALLFEVGESTIARWRKNGRWIERLMEQQSTDQDVRELATKALEVALKEYIKEPKGKDMQSLRGMLKIFIEDRKPSLSYLDHAIRFQKLFQEFCKQKGHNALLTEYNKYGIEFLDFIRLNFNE
jgi:hypothetical protein